ncbi:MAG: GntR family transcriptional regulator, partial [Cetobacterium sp.]
MIDKNSHTPIYVQLESILLEMIENGDLKPGDMIPSENELSKKYSISRMTAKKAIDSLTIKGLVERSQGKGTYVSSVEKKIELPINRLRGFTQKVCEMGLTPENRVLAFEKIPCPKNICKILGVEEGANVWRMERVRQIDEVPAVF